jgi:hypothetical protein
MDFLQQLYSWPTGDPDWLEWIAIITIWLISFFGLIAIVYGILYLINFTTEEINQTGTITAMEFEHSHYDHVLKMVRTTWHEDAWKITVFYSDEELEAETKSDFYVSEKQIQTLFKQFR